MKRFYLSRVLIPIITFVIVVIVAGWFIFLNTAIVKKNFHYILQPGTTGQQLATDLHQQTHLRYPILFRLLIKMRFAEHRLQAGEYLFTAGSSPSEILHQIVMGDTVSYEFIIVNGWNFQRVLEELNAMPTLQHTLKHFSSHTIAKKLGISYRTPEGLFFPNTYYYRRGTTDLKILKRAHSAMQNVLKKTWATRAKDLPYKTPYQILIVASMIEKEASVEKERPLIASVIVNRLKKGMPLQVDPTVIYGLGKDYHGNLTKLDLDTLTPYNTYIHYGLPPTPIAMPGRTAIDAALHPAKTDYLYFVAKGDDTHVFSKTLRTHDRAVIKYQLHGRKR